VKEYYYVVNGRYFAGQGMSYELPGDLPTGVVAVEGKYSGGLEDYVPPDKPNTAKRMKEYPPIGDQLDALWKLIQANSDKIDLGEAAPILEKIQGVKSKYPKTP
jgi:hypothetical protein